MKVKTNMKKVFVVLYAMLTLASFSVVSAAKQEASPDWVKNLPQAKTAKQLFVVAGVGKTTAWVSMHEKDADGNWRILMTTPGFLGKEGLEKTKEGDAKTPIGTFHFNAAFGIAKDPGCAIPYKQVDKNIYWSGDDRPGMKYNQMVDIREMPDLNFEDSEHIIDYDPHYTYAMNISYNEDGTPGLGSAIFLHCFGPYKPYTGGCVAIPVENMRFVMQNVRPDCVIVIDYLKKLSPETAEKWKI
jgi:L,D-peptidoglycan transpeptidase YkuD (ErfK/YbiS/YcfS/YnhG family)